MAAHLVFSLRIFILKGHRKLLYIQRCKVIVVSNILFCRTCCWPFWTRCGHIGGCPEVSHLGLQPLIAHLDFGCMASDLCVSSLPGCGKGACN